MRFFGILVIVVGLLFLIMVPPIGIVLIIVGLFMIVSGFGSSNAKKTATALAKQMSAMPQAAAPAAISNADTEKWAALSKYDDDVRAAVAQLQPYGTAALDKLRTTYLALNDKTKLSAIVADIQVEFAKPNRK